MLRVLEPATFITDQTVPHKPYHIRSKLHFLLSAPTQTQQTAETREAYSHTKLFTHCLTRAILEQLPPLHSCLLCVRIPCVDARNQHEVRFSIRCKYWAGNCRGWLCSQGYTAHVDGATAITATIRFAGGKVQCLNNCMIIYLHPRSSQGFPQATCLLAVGEETRGSLLRTCLLAVGEGTRGSPLGTADNTATEVMTGYAVSSCTDGTADGTEQSFPIESLCAASTWVDEEPSCVRRGPVVKGATRAELVLTDVARIDAACSDAAEPNGSMLPVA